MVFQNLTYNRETPCCNPKPIPVLLIMTSNAPAAYDMQILQKYQQTLNGFVGPTGSRSVSWCKTGQVAASFSLCADTIYEKYLSLDTVWCNIDRNRLELQRFETIFA